VADLADLSPRGAVGDNPESVPHGAGVRACVRACFEKSTTPSVSAGGERLLLPFFPFLVPPRLWGLKTRKRGGSDPR
jgi:hypothetical protein